MPNLQDLKLNPSLLPDSLLSFLTINDFSTKAEDLNKTNASLHSPLTLAAHKRDLIMAKHLVAQGARIDAQNALGNTALHICADTKDHYFAAWLLAVAKVLKLNLAVKNNNAKTPFDLARANGFEILINNEPILEPKALRFLSRHGFSTLRKDLNSPQDGGKLFTPLIKAAWEKDLDAVVGLVEAGADVSVANSLGNTAAHIAAERRDLFMYSWLRDHAANVRLANTSGVTAEQMAKQSFKFD